MKPAFTLMCVAAAIQSVSLFADSGAGHAGVSVEVQDSHPPVISRITVHPAVLWPPNHRMVEVTVTALVSDNSGGDVVWSVAGVSSNEPINGLGDGDTAPDWVITGDHTVELRAERGGSGNGRVYTLYIVARDPAGNVTTKTATVSVPKSKGRGGREDGCELDHDHEREHGRRHDGDKDDKDKKDSSRKDKDDKKKGNR